MAVLLTEQTRDNVFKNDMLVVVFSAVLYMSKSILIQLAGIAAKHWLGYEIHSWASKNPTSISNNLLDSDSYKKHPIQSAR